LIVGYLRTGYDLGLPMGTGLFVGALVGLNVGRFFTGVLVGAFLVGSFVGS